MEIYTGEQEKVLMRKYLNDDEVAKLEWIFSNSLVPMEAIAFSSGHYLSKHEVPTHLHKCICAVQTYPAINDYLIEYLKHNNQAINNTDKNGFSALHYAVLLSIKGNMIQTIKILIEAGIDLNAKNKYGKTALYYPGSSVVIKFIIEAGADLNICDSNLNTPVSGYVKTYVAATKYLDKIHKLNKKIQGECIVCYGDEINCIECEKGHLTCEECVPLTNTLICQLCKKKYKQI